MRLYLETTVFNWFIDDRPEREDVIALFEAIREGRHEGFTSQYVEYELRRTAEPKRNQMLGLIEEYEIQILQTSMEADELAEKYIAQGIIPPSYRLDSTHIACATIHGLDCVVSYNFNHINRIKTKQRTEAVNREEGYGSVVICTAREVLNDDQPEEERPV